MNNRLKSECLTHPLIPSQEGKLSNPSLGKVPEGRKGLIPGESARRTEGVNRDFNHKKSPKHKLWISILGGILISPLTGIFSLVNALPLSPGDRLEISIPNERYFGGV